MTDYAKVSQLVADIRQRVDQLDALVGQMADANTAAVAGGNRSLEAADDAAPPPPRTIGRLILPTWHDESDTIVNGVITSEFPDCCAVGGAKGYFCSGTLIAPNLVVTAKHCRNVTRVFLQSNNIADPANGEEITVAQELLHPDPNVDLRLLVLAQNSAVAPRHIAQKQEVHGGAATLVGFGVVDAVSGAVTYGIKRMVEVPITSLDCNGANDASTFGCHPGFEMVAGQRGLDKDSCFGDSGGPLYIKSQQGRYSLLGVTLRGVTSSVGCGDGGVYLRLDKFLDWIKQATGVAIPGPQFT